MGFFSTTSPSQKSISTDLLMNQSVSLPYILGQYKNVYGQTTGSSVFNVVGTGSISADGYGSTQISVNAGQYFILQTKIYHYYISSSVRRSELIISNFGVQANVVKRAGLYASNATAPYQSNLDGIMIVSDGTTISLQAHRDGTIIINEPITSWDGYSIYNLSSYDWNKSSLVVLDEIAQNGILRLSLLLSDGNLVEVHRVNYAQNFTTNMCKTPYRPFRCEIVSSTGSGIFSLISSKVSTYDGIFPVRKRSANTGSTVFTISTIGTKYVLCSLTALASLRDALLQVIGCGVVITSSDTLLIEIIKNPTLSTGSLTYNPITESSAEFASGNGTQTISAGSGLVLASAYVNQNSPLTLDSNNLLASIYGDINNNMEYIMVVGTPMTTTMTVGASIDYLEAL